MHRFIILCFLLLLAITAQSQDLMVAMSNNTYRQNNQELKRCDRVAFNEVLTIREAGYIGLIHPNGYTLELNSVGDFKLDTLFPTTTENQVVVSLSLDAYNNRDAMLGKTGSVSAGYTPFPRIVLPVMYKKVKILSDTVELFWRYALSHNKFDTNSLRIQPKISFSSPFEEELLTAIAQDTSYTLNYNDLPEDQGKRQSFVVFRIHPQGLNPSETYVIAPSSIANREAVRKSFAQMEYTTTATLAQVLYLYQEGYFFDAFQQCRTLIKNYPDYPDLKDWYSQLLTSIYYRVLQR